MAIAFGLSLTSIPANALAQTYIPPDRGLPGRREGGGTRGGCVLSQPPLTALMPQTNFGVTTQAHPSLFWYVPQTTATAAELELRNEQEATVYTTQIPLTGKPGIIQVKLPENSSAAALEVGKTYHWYFSLICNPQDRSGDVITEGWIERSAPDAALIRQLAAVEADSPAKRLHQQATLYAASGIWYDALSTLAELQSVQPHDPTTLQSWKRLLTSVELGKFSDQPLAASQSCP